MNKPWYQSLAKIMWWIFTRMMAPFMALGWPLLALYGALHPITLDYVALHLRFGEQPILMGVSGGEPNCEAAALCVASAQRLYLIVPQVFTNGAIFAVNGTTDRLTVVREPGLAIVFLIVWCASIFGTWHYLALPLFRHRKDGSGPRTFG